MKKYILNMLTVVLLLLCSCTKDNLIKEEQTSNAGEAITQVEKSSNRYGSEKSTFYSSSTDTACYYLENNPTTGEIRKILKNGTFNGSLTLSNGPKKIISSLSRYTIDYFNKIPNPDYYPNDTYPEPWMYELQAHGRISVGTMDYCDITIKGTLWPNYIPGAYTDPFRDRGNFPGTGVTSNGVGLLKTFNKTFSVYPYSSGQPTPTPGITLSTGQVRFIIKEL